MRFIQEGGWAMYPLICTGLFGFVLGIVAVGIAFAKKKTPGLALGAVTLAVSLLGCVVMGFGYFQARQAIDAAIAYADPSSQAAIRAQGLSEAMNIITFGLCTGALPLVLGAVAVARAATLKTTGRPEGA